MATKQEFLAELQEQNTTLKSWLQDVGSEIATRNSEVSNLGAKRREALDTAANRLLPNLKESTVNALGKVIPGFLTDAEVSAMIAKEGADIEGRVKDLLSRFDPGKGKVRAVELELAIAKEKESGAIVKDGLGVLTDIPGFTELVESGYGTPAYEGRWWQLRYYRDWSSGDLFASAARKKDWTEALAYYNELTSSTAASAKSLGDMAAEAKEISDNEKLLAELREDLGNVDATVLELAKVQLRARLDSLAPTPEWMKEVSDIDAKTAELRKDVDEVLHPRREKLAEQLAKLQGMIVSVTRSKERSVPDKYVAAARESNKTMRSGTYASPTTVIYRDDSSWLETFLWYDLVTNHYGSHSSGPAYGGTSYPMNAPSGGGHVSEETYGRVS